MLHIPSASSLTGSTLHAAPFSPGLLWMIALSIGLGTSPLLAVLALDARHQPHRPAAPSLHQVHGLAVSVATA
jgi:hypothetical protein